MFHRFSRLQLPSLLLTLRNVIGMLVFSFFPIFLRSQSYDIWFIILMTALYTGVCVIVILFVPRYPIRTSLLAGFLCHAAAVLSLFFPLPYAAYIYSLFVGLTLVFFWVPINYLFFASSERNTNAVDSSLYLFFPGIIAIIIPPLGAWLITEKGFSFVFLIASLFIVIPLFIVFKYIPNEKHEAPLRASTASFKGLKTITICEGALHMFPAQVIPIYALLFLNTAQEFGHFLSYVALVAFIISFFVSSQSDKMQQRKKYLYFFFILLAFSTVLMVAVKNTTQWLLIVGFYILINQISFPLRLAASMDVKKVDMGFWKVRELFLNIGRVLVQGIAALFFYLQLPWAVFGMFAIISIVYPFLVEKKLKELR